MNKLLFILPFILSTAYAYNQAGSLILDYRAESNITITRLNAQARLINLTQNIYLYAQDVNYLSSDFNDFTIINSEFGNYLRYVNEGDAELLPWAFNARISSARKITTVTKIPVFPLDQTKIPVNIRKYLEFDDYIIYNQEIAELANEIVSGSINYFDAVMRLGKWVSNNIIYTPTNEFLNGTKDAGYVLEKRQGVCDEFSILFMSLARVVGIPVKYSYGYAYSNYFNILGFGPHAWVEVWLPDGGGWMPMDLTYNQYGWLDPSHIKMYSGSNLTSNQILTTCLSNADRCSNLKIELQVPEYLKASLSSGVQGFISVVNETEESIVYRGNLVLSKTSAGEEDYVLMTVRVYNPTSYYVPLSYEVITTNEMIFVRGGRTNPIILGPRRYTEDYIILKTPVIGRSVKHPINVKLPGTELIETELIVTPQITTKTPLNELELQVAGKESILTDFRIFNIKAQPRHSYSNSTVLNFTVWNLGSTVMENVTVQVTSRLIQPVNVTLPRIMINEKLNLTVNLSKAVDYGDESVNVFINLNNKVAQNSTTISFMKQPSVELMYEGKKVFKPFDNLNFTVVINKYDSILLSTLKITIKNDNFKVDRTQKYILNNLSINFELPPEYLSLGDDYLIFEVEYADIMGVSYKDTYRQELSKTGDWWEVMIYSLSRFFAMLGILFSG